MGKYTRQNSTGDAGEYLVGYTFAGQFGWAYRILDSDTGIDGEVEIYDGEAATGRILKVQVKSTGRLVGTISKDESDATAVGNTFRVSIKKVDVLYWRMLALPVILCIADISQKRVFFREIDSSIEVPDVAAETFQIEVPIANELLPAQRDRLVALAPLRDFNPLERLLQLAEMEIQLLRQVQGGQYLGDAGHRFRELRTRCFDLVRRIRSLSELGGWLLHEASKERVDAACDEVQRQINRIDRELHDWEVG